MPVAAWCLLIVTIMPVLVVGYAKAGGHYNNNEPRLWLQTLEGRRRRAYAAHLNCYEALPVFLAALFVAVWTDGPQGRIDALSIGFVLFRAFYVFAYIIDRASLRSILWSLAYLCVIGLFISGYWSQA